MGLDLSRVEPPVAWPFSSWDGSTLQSFVSFVRDGGDGSFRISKWHMLQFAGSEHLKDITDVFAVLEERDETAVSSLHLAVALLLCSQSVSVDFKISESLRLFDWSGDGTMTVSDFSFFLQVIAKALGKCVSGIPLDIRQDEFNRLAEEAVGDGVATLVALAKWARQRGDVAGLLARLSPQDTAAAGPEAAAASPRRPAAAAAVPRRPAETSPLQAVARAVGGDGSEPTPELAAASASPRERPVEASIVNARVAAEPPLAQAPTRRDLAAGALARHLQRALQELEAQVQAERLRQQLHGGAPVLARSKALERQWAYALGASLPCAAGALWPPLGGEPLRGEVQRAALASWPHACHAACVERARFEVVAAAAGLCGVRHGAADRQRRAAASAAAGRLAAWMASHAGIRSADAAAAREALLAELGSCELAALEATRGLYAARSMGSGAAVAGAHRLNVARLEGAVECAEGLLPGKGCEPVQELLRQVQAALVDARRAEATAEESAHEAAKKLHEFQAAELSRSCLEAAVAADKHPWPVLARRVQELRSTSAFGECTAGPGAGEEFGLLARSLVEVAELRLGRCEGPLLALRMLLGGLPVAQALMAHEAEHLGSGSHAAAACGYFGVAPEVACRPPRRPPRVLAAVAAALEQRCAGGASGGGLAEARGELLQVVLQNMSGDAAGSGALQEAASAGPAGEAAPPGNLTLEELMLLRRQRFMVRFYSAALRHARDALGAAGGGLVAALEQRLLAAEEARAAAEGSAAAKQRAQEKLRSHVEEVLDSYSRGEGLPPAARCTAGSLGAALRSAHLQLYGDCFAAAPRPDEAAALRPDGRFIDSWSFRHLCGDEEGESSGEPWRLVRHALHRQAAALAGFFCAAELVHVRAVAADGEVSADVLLHCAELRAEARLLGVLASGRLALAELQLRRAADGSCAQSWSRLSAESAPRGPTAVDPRDGEAALEALRAAELRLLTDCGKQDVEATLSACRDDCDVDVSGTLSAAAARLLNELGHNELFSLQGAAAVADAANGSSASTPARAPQVCHPSEWWRAEHAAGPLFMVSTGGLPCARCLEVSRLTWESLAKFAGATAEPPKDALEEHAAALRVWILSRHRLLAVDALLCGCWTGVLPHQLLRDAELLAADAWRRELGRRCVGQLAEGQVEALERACQFLHPLDPNTVEFLLVEDLEASAEAARADLAAGSGAWPARPVLGLSASLAAAGLLSAAADGLQQGTEVLSRTAAASAGGLRPLNAHKLAQVADLLLTSGSRLAPPLGREGGQQATSCLGELCAIRRLRAFCLQRDAMAEP